MTSAGAPNIGPIHIASVENAETISPAGTDLVVLLDVSDSNKLKTATVNNVGTGGSVTVTDNIQIRLNGGGFAITTGTKYPALEVPWDCTIVGARILLDQSATMTVDIWKDTYANYPPDNSDSITAAAPIGSSAANKGQDTTLTGWTTSLSEGDIILINVDANDNATFATIVLDVTRTV